MTQALVDATVLIAAFDSDDEDHETGLEIVEAIDHGRLPTGLMTSEAVLETLHFVEERMGHDRAVDILDRLVRGAHFELPDNPEKNYGIGRSLFRNYRGLNFGDSMQAAFMQSRDVEYRYSFDDDFDSVVDVTRLDRAMNPYRE